ncbi:hypothetical protein BASA50_001292 [Batrachochytrium salamandrivorans]|uniref:UBZ4-type domain-containing protein n=1 Tax=Batrachochytrium salamandrivorans TaxID=1357716 RepID=A0ABQ8EVU1_9FUNG|nr:hypothetical protein BASA62_006816 [Batrachochytrium salamandrivorans]KAH6587363.1 hypothetical protein BASA50_001292 [Batrachochytrium salamandrivorans]
MEGRKAGLVECPVCNASVSEAAINMHLDAGCDATSRSPTQYDAGSGQLASSLLPAKTPALAGRTQTRLPFLTSPQPLLKRPRDDDALDTHSEEYQKQSHSAVRLIPTASLCKPPSMHRPLADMARPTSLDEFYGQDTLIGQSSLLRQLVASKKVPCMILWGPPGSGKTTLARIIAKELGVYFKEMSATIHNVADVRKASDEARNHRQLTGKKSILFLDEIHRFTKAQQDFFLPPVERGDFIFVAATTENPSFRVNAALLSRCRVFVMEKHEPLLLQKILSRAAAIKLSNSTKQQHISQESILSSASTPLNSTDKNPESIHPASDASTVQPISDFVPNDVIVYISNMSDGDARAAINVLEMSIDSALYMQATHISIDTVRLALSKSHLLYDRQGEEHYNIISALHKSMRGSDANAALYWLGRMIYAGEDPLYVARRLVRFASEDIGLADSNALTLAMTTYQACQVIGMPECDVILAHCVTYLAQAPKCVKVYRAIKKVKQAIMESSAYPVPLHLRNAPTQLMKEVGYGMGYIYNPDHEGQVDQDYLPPQLKGMDFL